ncbi:4E-binding protein [Cavenderia fasciculata]|uniref:4E-binding protein n=1 Tax=Cavenderia fasciculata TaxID=261658 RepID=F4PG51_CACFS|nr:4E-binding protein [Cavenderia fasciculata]EGG24685.1 4E-binding protein [Cavenderia fasciculata]|eukprot:XP_004362536.1 4E-binding protein [Cavenderia fasciculata]
MSVPSSAASTTSRAIPFNVSRQDMINFSTSLGGTLYGTTPGGTKLVYDKNTLLQYRNSPLAKTPPPPEMANMLNMINKSQSSPHPHSKPIHSNKQPAAASTSAEAKNTTKQNEDDIFEMD